MYICNLIRSKSFEQINALASGGMFVVREPGRTCWVGGLLKRIVTYLLSLSPFLLLSVTLLQVSYEHIPGFQDSVLMLELLLGELFSPSITPNYTFQS